MPDPLTRADLERLLPKIGEALGEQTHKAIARYHETAVAPLRNEVQALRDEITGLRAARSGDARGVRHRFTEVIADPAAPGSALLLLEDGSHIAVGREQAERWHDTVAGRA